MSTRLNSAKARSQPPRSSDRRAAAIQELRRGAELADLLRKQVELIPEPNRRDAAVANVGEISTALESSLYILQSQMEHPSSPELPAVAAASYSSDGGTRERNGAVARARRVRHRRGRNGADLPIKEILTDAPENDRFHWRKYGEKNILNAEYPRYVSSMEFQDSAACMEDKNSRCCVQCASMQQQGKLEILADHIKLYYKCGYSDDHKCPAKKYVQQQSNNNGPPLFLVTLLNEHTCETLFQQDEPSSSSSSASQVLDFTKATISTPLMAPTPGLKKEEEDIMSMSMHSYSYDEYLSSSLPAMSPDGDEVKFSPRPGW